MSILPALFAYNGFPRMPGEFLRRTIQRGIFIGEIVRRGDALFYCALIRQARMPGRRSLSAPSLIVSIAGFPIMCFQKLYEPKSFSNKAPAWIFHIGNIQAGVFYPCFNGLLIQSPACLRHVRRYYFVSILVLMDYSFRETSKEQGYWHMFPQSLF